MRKVLLAVGLAAAAIAALVSFSARSTDAGTQRKPAKAPAGKKAVPPRTAPDARRPKIMLLPSGRWGLAVLVMHFLL